MKINRISIRDFKGIVKYESTFPENTIILGDNGKGKTTILDAIYWVLMGYDTEERKVFEIRPLTASGNLKKYTETYVRLWITLDDGTEHIIEKYFQGGETKVKIDEYSKTIGELQDFISANIINFNKFRLFFNPKYFPGLPWKEARDEFLKYFKMPQVDEIINNAEKPIVGDVREELKIASPDDIIQKYRDKKKEIEKEQTRSQAQLDEITDILAQNNFTPGMDIEQLKAERDKLRGTLENYNQSVFEYNAYVKEVNLIDENIERLQREIEYNKRLYAGNIKMRYERIGADKQQEIEKLEELKNQYAEINKSMQAEHKCPYCGAMLQKEKLAEVMAKLKIKRDENIKAGTACKETIKKLEAMEKQYESGDYKNKPIPEVEDMKAQIAELEERKKSIKEVKEPESVGKTMLRHQEINNQLALYETNKRHEQAQKTLKNNLREFAKDLENCQKNVISAENFVHEQARYIVSKVNENFRNIRIELFKTLKNGTEKETFTIKLNGVPYSDLNRAGKIIAGLEIQRYFKKHTKNKIPVIIDDFESYPSINIQEYIAEGEQSILSIVKEGAQLQILKSF